MQMYGMSGEPLGLIGQAEPSQEQLPGWKKDFLSKPSASIRKGIAWGFDSAYEDTDTLVLTARSGKFVDVRFPKEAGTFEQAVNRPCYWAFSGESKTTFYDVGSQEHAVGLPFTAHCVFEHDIDSRGPGIIDEGDMFTLQNGDCLEMGTMINPVTGKNQLYKEYWVSAPPSSYSPTHDDPKSTAVAVATNEKGMCGIVIRVGGRIQGITRSSSRPQVVQASRWERTIDSSGTSSWICDHRSKATVPWEWLADRDRQVGDTIEFSELVWQITERHQE